MPAAPGCDATAAGRSGEGLGCLAVLERVDGVLDGPVGPALIAALLLLAVGWYLSYLAARLDRLHHRVESSYAALEARLARRAAVAREAGHLLGPAGDVLVAAAGRTLARASARPHVSEAAENDLTRALHQAFDQPGRAAGLRRDPVASELLDELVGAEDSVQLARRFHNDAVAHAQRMRRKRLVRWARLAGRAAMPQMVEIDDSHPNGLGGDA